MNERMKENIPKERRERITEFEKVRRVGGNNNERKEGRPINYQ